MSASTAVLTVPPSHCASISHSSPMSSYPKLNVNQQNECRIKPWHSSHLSNESMAISVPNLVYNKLTENVRLLSLKFWEVVKW